MKVFFFISFFLLLYTNTKLLAYETIDYEFITKFEYGQMLYENPRGIGCNRCHGDDGKGRLIAKYKNKKGLEKSIIAPDITSVSWEIFKKTLSDKSDSSTVMPTYFLTEDELSSIYEYIKAIKKK